MLCGDEEPTEGTLTFAKNLRIAVLRQDQFSDDAERILDVVQKGDTEVYEALQELDALAKDPNPDAGRISELNERLIHHDGHTLEPRAREMLAGLGISDDRATLPLGSLSGGYKLRVLLAQVLIGRPDVMFLDEPTNHLDILSIRWLEKFLQAYRGCAVIISHDRRFLDAVATRVLDVDYGTIMDYAGNYTGFLQAKEETRARKEVEIARVEKEIAQKKAFVERFKAKATKARQAQSRAKQLEKMEVDDLPPSSRRAPHFKFDVSQPTGREVLKVKDIHKAYGEKKVLNGVGFQVFRGERIAIIGANGIGKSTLLKILAERLEQDQGEFEWGANAALGYFAQDHHDLLGDPKGTPLDYVWDVCPQESVSFVRGQLGRMLFSGEDVEKKFSALSGGEAARVVFARLGVEKPNVLILDEPTNHLDLESIEALQTCLKSYTGTLIFVSHDRYFVNNIATRIIDVRADGLHDFQGTYEEFVARAGDDHLDADQVVLKAKAEKKARQNQRAPRGPRHHQGILGRTEKTSEQEEVAAEEAGQIDGRNRGHGRRKGNPQRQVSRSRALFETVYGRNPRHGRRPEEIGRPARKSHGRLGGRRGRACRGRSPVGPNRLGAAVTFDVCFGTTRRPAPRPQPRR